MLYIAVTPMPRDPIGTANGVYSGSCCGTLVLRDGILSFGDTSVRYVVEHDKGGPYVLPDAYVGVVGGTKLRLDRTKDALIIRLQDSDAPKSLSVPGSDRDGQYSEYSFVEEER